MMMYEWDETKSQSNFEKHGLRFKDAETVFSSPCVTFLDNRANYGEDRFITIGTLAARVVIVVHTYRSAATRIISMRKANDREQEIYRKRLGTH
jgi:uncharacterized DUF497 family protein